MRFAYLKLSLGNISRSVRDYSVYFATLAFAACLLYSFTASGDFLLALDLTQEQRELYGSAAIVTQAFSVFSVVVFAFLVSYANRFILRRRSREFGIYGLLGMDAGQVARLLVYEGCLVALAALAIGIAAGVLASPVFGAVASFVFEAPWQLVFVASPGAMGWTAGCFAFIMAFALMLGIRDVRNRPLVQLLSADRTPQQPKGAARFSLRLQAVLAGLLLAFVWGSCLLQPAQFIALILPMGVLAVLATAMVFRVAVIRWTRRASRNPRRYWQGLRCFTLGQVRGKVSSSANAMACTCVLIAVAVCMMAAGFAFSVGMRGPGSIFEDTRAFAPVGYIGIFYGMTFLVAAAAVLALQQLAEAADSRIRYRQLDRLGCDRRLMRRSIRAQLGLYFAAPAAFALVHDVFGLLLVGFLAFIVGSSSFVLTAAAVIGVTLGLLGIYYLITCRQCERMLLPSLR